MNAQQIRELQLPGEDDDAILWVIFALKLLKEATAQLADIRHEIHHQTEESTRGGDPR